MCNHEEHKRIDVGCGTRGGDDNCVGIDFIDYGQKYVRDITKGLPFCDNSVEFIRCHNTLEHIRSEDVILLLNEMWRVLKPGGRADIIVPPATHHNAFADPTHKSFWNTSSFAYVSGSRPRNSSIGLKHWNIIEGTDKEDEIRRIMEPKDK